RLGLASTDDPAKIEQQLMEIVPRKEWDAFSLRLIYFGREICTAKRPMCLSCPLNRLCPSAPFGGNPPWMRRRALARRPWPARFPTVRRAQVAPTVGQTSE